jgi:hypothetical protein
VRRQEVGVVVDAARGEERVFDHDRHLVAHCSKPVLWPTTVGAW